MKTCSWCGKKYANDVSVCPMDGHRVVDRQFELAAHSLDVRAAFNVKLTSPLSVAGLYRVFVEQNELLFIQIEGGSRSVLEALAPLVGPFGAIIPFAFWLFSKQRTESKRKRIEEGSPEDLFPENEKNFRLHLAEIREASIEGPALFSESRQAGRLNLIVRHGERIKCALETAADMKNAIRLLGPLLHATLRVNVVWNEAGQQFEANKKD